MNNKKIFDFETTFPPLGHPDHHFNKYPEHPWIKTKEDVKNWIVGNIYGLVNFEGYRVGYKNFIINDDLTVISEKDFIIEKNKLSHIPIQFRSSEVFKCSDGYLKSLIGTPYICKELNLENNEILDLNGMGVLIDTINIEGNKLKNFTYMNSVRRMSVVNNLIDSWDGFSSCEDIRIGLHNSHYCENLFTMEMDEGKFYDLLIKAPKSIKKVFLEYKFKNKEVQTIEPYIKNNKERQVNMIWLRKIQSIIENNEIISEIDINNSKLRKRKL